MSVHPVVNGGHLFGQAAWPKAVDEHTHAVFWCSRFVDSLQSEMFCGNARCHAIGSSSRAISARRQSRSRPIVATASFRPWCQNVTASSWVARSRSISNLPLLGAIDVGNDGVVVLAPEERNGAERLLAAKHILCSYLSLPLGDNPMFDTDLLACPVPRCSGNRESRS
jgi:hypothetical protein